MNKKINLIITQCTKKLNIAKAKNSDLRIKAPSFLNKEWIKNNFCSKSSIKILSIAFLGCLLLLFYSSSVMFISPYTEPVDSGSGAIATSEFNVSPSNEEESHVVEYPPEQMCFIGDIRMSDLKDCVITDAAFICNNNADKTWISESAIPEFEKIKNKCNIIIVSFGINNLKNPKEDAKQLNAFADKYKNKYLTYLTVGPVKVDSETISNADIENYNNTMVNSLNDKWQILDMYEYLSENKFVTTEQTRYDTQTSAKIFAWVILNVKTQKIVNAQ